MPGRRLEIVTVGTNPNLQLVGSSPTPGGVSDLGLWIGTMLLPTLDLGWIVLICAVCFVPFVPMVTRYARVIWIFFDRWAWPSSPDETDPSEPEA